MPIPIAHAHAHAHAHAQLIIPTQGTGEEVDRETNAGQYGGKVVLVTDT